VIAKSTWSSISSTTEDSDAAKKDVTSSLSSIKSQTQAAEFHRASSSASTSRHGILLHPAASSCWLASLTQLESTCFSG
jgi:hypothetical protein